MAVSRYSQYYQPEYTPEPLDALLQVGMMKRQQLVDNVKQRNEAVDLLGNIPSVGLADTNKKNEILQQAEDRMNEISKSGRKFDDPLIAAEINSVVHGVMNNPDIQKIVGDYKAYQTYLGNTAKLKGEGKYSESHDFPVASRWASFMDDPQYTTAPIMSQYTNIDTPSDYRERINKLFDKVKMSGSVVETTDGKWIYKTTRKQVNPNDLIKWGLQQGFLTQNDLKSLKYDANYQYQGLGSDYKKQISPTEYEDGYYNKVLSDTAPFYGQYETGDEIQLRGDYLAAYSKSLDEISADTVPAYAPGVPTNTQKFNFKVGDKGEVIVGSKDRSALINEQNHILNVAGAMMQPLSGLTAAFLNRINYAFKNGETVDPNQLPTEDKLYYKDLENKVQQARIAEGKAPLTGEALNKGIHNYLEAVQNNINDLGNPVINQYKNPKQVEKESQLYFIPGEGKNAGKTTLQGAYVTRKFYTPQFNGTALSGEQWLEKFGGSTQPKAIGSFGPDNPYTAYGMPIQTGDGKLHWMEGDIDQVQRNPVNQYSHQIYLSKWQVGSNSNYFPLPIGDKDYIGGSNYDPETNSYDFRIIDKQGNTLKESKIGNGGEFQTPEEAIYNLIMNYETVGKELNGK